MCTINIVSKEKLLQILGLHYMIHGVHLCRELIEKRAETGNLHGLQELHLLLIKIFTCCY